PGCEPDVFSFVRIQRDGSGGSPRFGPRAISSAETVVAPIRFVNQFESGTSSMVLMFCARVPDGRYAAVTNRLLVISYIEPMKYGLAFDASCDSGSRAMGSSGKKCGD